MEIGQIRTQLAFLGKEFLDEILQYSEIKSIPENVEILREDQYVKVIPIVLSGLVKVYSRFQDRDMLLYYIQPSQSCIMSFSASLHNNPSRVFAVTDQKSEILLLPVDKIPSWIKSFPLLNILFFDQYNLRYLELLDTINTVMFEKLDSRLMAYLLEKSNLTHQTTLQLTHHQIARELGTAREVVSRVMKKLESEGKIIQLRKVIKIV